MTEKMAPLFSDIVATEVFSFFSFFFEGYFLFFSHSRIDISFNGAIPRKERY